MKQLAIVLACLTGCGGFGRAMRAVEGVTAVLDRATNTIAHESTAMQQALRDAIADLGGIADDVAAELQHILDAAVQGLGQEARCTGDFVADRVEQSLVALKVSLIGGPKYTRKPVFCTVRPSSISYEAWRNNGVPTISISGYDLDSAKFTARLVEAKRQIPLDAEALINHVGPYQLVLNLREELVKLSGNTLQLVLDGSRGPPLEIAVEKAPRPACGPKVSRSIPGHTSIHVAASRHTKGDTNFAGHGPSLWAAVDVFADGRDLRARFRIRASETRADWTMFEGESTTTFATLGAEYEDYDIVQIRPAVHARTTERVVTAKYFPKGSSPVERIVFTRDLPPPLRGVYGATATMHDLMVDLQRVRNCYVEPAHARGGGGRSTSP